MLNLGAGSQGRNLKQPVVFPLIGVYAHAKRASHGGRISGASLGKEHDGVPITLRGDLARAQRASISFYSVSLKTQRVVKL